MTKTAIVGAMALVGMTAFADSAFWTGAQDNFWTNAANWVQANGSPAVAAPGIVSNGVDDVWSATMTYDTAVFDRASARTTIDLDGLHVMRNITVTGADTPTYTFGTSSAQTLRIVSEAQSNSYNNGGRITVETSTVHAPVFAATLSAVASGTINEGFHVVNNSAQTITLGDIGRYIDAKPIGV